MVATERTSGNHHKAKNQKKSIAPLCLAFRDGPLAAGRTMQDDDLLRRRQDAKLTYSLGHSDAKPEISVRYQSSEVTVTLPTEEARRWYNGNQVGLYRDFVIGREALAVLVEKAFACLDGCDIDDEDAFENPDRGTAC